MTSVTFICILIPLGVFLLPYSPTLAGRRPTSGKGNQTPAHESDDDESMNLTEQQYCTRTFSPDMAQTPRPAPQDDYEFDLPLNNTKLQFRQLFCVFSAKQVDAGACLAECLRVGTRLEPRREGCEPSKPIQRRLALTYYRLKQPYHMKYIPLAFCSAIIFQELIVTGWMVERKRPLMDQEYLDTLEVFDVRTWLHHNSHYVPVYLGVGGDRQDSAHFSRTLRNRGFLARLVNDLVNSIRSQAFTKGAYIDWDRPRGRCGHDTDTEHLQIFLDALNRRGLTKLMLAVPPQHKYAKDYDLSAVLPFLEHVVVKTHTLMSARNVVACHGTRAMAGPVLRQFRADFPQDWRKFIYSVSVFTCLALFNLLKVPLNAFPWVLNGLMEAWVSLGRTQRFLSLPDFEPASYYSQAVQGREVVRITAGIFHWGTAQGDLTLPRSISGASSRGFCLGPISLCLEQGQLLGVVGPVGSGKSTLLAAISGEVSRVQGSVSLAHPGRPLGLVPQEPWLQRGTLRANVLFGKPFDATRYHQVLQCCALLDDLRSLPAGDLTQVGEDGQALSGGQKRRVALARALYQDCDVYLLDDPLSALDAHVAEHVFNQCVLGAMKGKARILVTHQVGFLSSADHVVALRDGAIVASGPPSVVLGRSVGDAVGEGPTQASPRAARAEGDSGEGPTEVPLEPEAREIGAVRLSTVRSYWDAVGAWLALAVILFVLLMQVSRTSTDWWLAAWVSWSNSSAVGVPRFMASLRSAGGGDVLSVFLPVYGGLAVANGFLTLARAFLFAYGGIAAAVKIHDLLLDKVLKAPLWFVESCPAGRVLNRFSTDVWSIDDTLPFVLNILLAQGAALAGTLVVTAYGLPWITLVLLPLGFGYNSLQQYYRWTSRELKRLSSVTLSPVYSHLSETLAGIPVIRSLGSVSRFCQENLHKVALNQQAVFAALAASQWLNLRLQLLGVLLTSCVALLAVVQHQVRGVSAGFVGLALSYALSVTSLLGSLVTSFTDTEKELVSVERAGQYLRDLEEEPLEGTLLPPFGWPFCGVLEFSKVTLRYREGHPAALRDVSFEAPMGAKVGVVGRTGAGKSSLLQALFRLVPVESGHIFIDGVDVTKVGPREVRQRLAAIPQEPFIFSGSVRDNVDPRGLHSDTQLWHALDKCQLGGALRALGGDLGMTLGRRGCRLSVGQRQLLCLARALLYKTRVLCLDEATAAVDADTDRAIQQTIRSIFGNTTILLIAHRVQTVLDCDQVLVMSHGRIVESGSPAELLKRPGGQFLALVEASRRNGGQDLIAADDDERLLGLSDQESD
ncbi:ATP-binding cassette sub-family C member 10 [Ixodes scapularis]